MLSKFLYKHIDRIWGMSVGIMIAELVTGYVVELQLVFWLSIILQFIVVWKEDQRRGETVLRTLSGNP